MNIISLIDENISSIADYYNLSKSLYEEIINYVNTYKIQTSQYSQKISNLQKEYENKITSLKGKFQTNIYNEHLFEYVNIFPNIIKKQLSNYSPLFDLLELFIKNFSELINQKINLIKAQQEQYNESKKNFLLKYQEIENSKASYFNNLSITEETIIQYYSQKKVDNEDMIYNQRTDSDLSNTEKNQRLEEKVNNLIKETKTMEKNYKAVIESSKLIRQKVKENSEKFENIIQISLNEISDKYHNDIINIIGLVKISLQEPLSILNTYLSKICRVYIKNELDELYKKFSNKNVISANIFPSKYKLKTIELMNNNNDNNIFSLSMLDKENEEDLEKLNNEKEEISEINLLVIKNMYKNFSLLSANKLDIKTEEEKVQTKKLSNKLFLNVKSYNNTRKINIPQEKIFSQKDFEDLEKLIDKIEYRYIFLQRLTRFRALKYDFSLKYFVLIGKLLNGILSKFEQDNDHITAKNCIILSQTFYCNYQKEKVYLKAYIQNNPIFKTQKFWEILLDNLVKENEVNSNGNQKENIFGNVYTLINNMFDFGLNENEIKNIIEPKIKKYNLDNHYLRNIDELIKIKVENGTYIEENKKYVKYIKEIIEEYNKEIKEELENKEKNDDKINTNIDNKNEEKTNKNNKFNKNLTFNKNININNNKKVPPKINKSSKKLQSIWELDES